MLQQQSQKSASLVGKSVYQGNLLSPRQMGSLRDDISSTKVSNTSFL